MIKYSRRDVAFVSKCRQIFDLLLSMLHNRELTAFWSRKELKTLFFNNRSVDVTESSILHICLSSTGLRAGKKGANP